MGLPVVGRWGWGPRKEGVAQSFKHASVLPPRFVKFFSSTQYLVTHAMPEKPWGILNGPHLMANNRRARHCMHACTQGTHPLAAAMAAGAALAAAGGLVGRGAAGPSAARRGSVQAPSAACLQEDGGAPSHGHAGATDPAVASGQAVCVLGGSGGEARVPRRVFPFLALAPKHWFDRPRHEWRNVAEVFTF